MNQMTDIVGIRFPSSGKTYSFGAGEGLDLRIGDRVVVESELGISIGTVVKPNAVEGQDAGELRPVLRKVTAADIKQEEENEEAKREALIFCNERISARGLDMKLITADVTLDRKRFIFYFVSETRIDFRELVKDLAAKLRARIELRQIGVRDAAKLIGGFGICGKEVCCKTWLKGFAPISIKMAKQQDLVLNTCKLSGLCGRLMCCLNYEYDEEALKHKRKKHRPQQEGAEAEAPASEAAEAPAEAQEPEIASTVTAAEGPELKAHEDRAPEQRSTESRTHEQRRYEQRDRRPQRPEPHDRQPAASEQHEGVSQQAAQEGSPFKKRRRKRRKGRGTSGPEGQQSPTQHHEPRPDAQPSEHRPDAQAENKPGGDDISRSKRRRMRRNRHKKPHGGQSQGGQPGGGQSQGSAPQGGSPESSGGQ